ncbi:MAG: hypothetical protein EP335_16375 [Alphaproteobacteria bacterium]|nr:MAG: hypothetical protein EP335_16375 [Alphaproteobacteria bacterium]
MDKKPEKTDMPDFGDLASLWQEGPAMDMSALARRTRFLGWRTRIFAAFEATFCLAMVVFAIFALDWSRASHQIVGAFCILFSLAGAWVAIESRRGAWDVSAGSARDLVALQIRRARAGIRYMRLNVLFGYASLLLIPLGYWKLVQDLGGWRSERMIGLHAMFLFLISFVIGFHVFTRYYTRRKQAEIAAFSKLLQEMSDEISAAADETADEAS